VVETLLQISFFHQKPEGSIHSGMVDYIWSLVTAPGLSCWLRQKAIYGHNPQFHFSSCGDICWV